MAVLSPRLPATAELLEALGKSSRGNPLALHRALGRLVTAGALARQDGCWGLAEQRDGMAETGGEPALINSLSPRARLVLAVAGLLSETFDGALLSCVLEDKEKDGLIPTTMSALASSGFLIEDIDGYRLEPGFPLEKLLEDFTAREIRNLHERIATLLLELNPSPGSGLCMRIAGQLDEAGREAEAFAYYRAAARLGAGIMGTSVTGATAPFGAEMMAGHFGVATTTGLATAVAAMTTGSVIAAVATEMVELLLLV